MKRCSNGSRRFPPKKGVCTPINEIPRKHRSKTQKRKRCPNGTRRSKNRKCKKKVKFM